MILQSREIFVWKYIFFTKSKSCLGQAFFMKKSAYVINAFV